MEFSADPARSQSLSAFLLGRSVNELRYLHQMQWLLNFPDDASRADEVLINIPSLGREAAASEEAREWLDRELRRLQQDWHSYFTIEDCGESVSAFRRKLAGSSPVVADETDDDLFEQELLVPWLECDLPRNVKSCLDTLPARFFELGIAADSMIHPPMLRTAVQFVSDLSDPQGADDPPRGWASACQPARELKVSVDRPVTRSDWPSPALITEVQHRFAEICRLLSTDVTDTFQTATSNSSAAGILDELARFAQEGHDSSTTFERTIERLGLRIREPDRRVSRPNTNQMTLDLQPCLFSLFIHLLSHPNDWHTTDWFMENWNLFGRRGSCSPKTVQNRIAELRTELARIGVTLDEGDHAWRLALPDRE